MTQAEWEALLRDKGLEPIAPETTTGHVMPPRALRYQAQRIGLFTLSDRQ